MFHLQVLIAFHLANEDIRRGFLIRVLLFSRSINLLQNVCFEMNRKQPTEWNAIVFSLLYVFYI